MVHSGYFIRTFLWVLFGAFCLPAQAENTDWWAIDREVVKPLFTKDVGNLSDELAGQKVSRQATDLLKQLNVFIRAGHEKRALQAIDQLEK
jgi:hypothetical protein